jgi:hypothetical protein
MGYFWIEPSMTCLGSIAIFSLKPLNTGENMKDTTVKKIDSALLELFAAVEAATPQARIPGRDEA